ncbi:hypothetical protein TTHT_1036 [Thermotomaculum hydrothermale]|uniref:Uncharacterized protein n=1 Tax=Thermotomaculum hydrothermale TaxID=981385 RepID=A0A7R6SYF2_9BACT|nr:hypothetical protein [Thermotomaculum hydrothermale]BBB32575.1 hypothetical protein TTHT_1036 [Thermotomaculum hydrothermale]
MILEIDGINTRFYLHKYANFYSFIYLLKRIFNDAVSVEDWDIYFPDIDRSIELNIFIGEENQIKEWLLNEKFCFVELWEFKYKYFFIEENKHLGKIKKINLYTNVEPMVEKFKKQEILDKIFSGEKEICENNINPEYLKEIKIIEEDVLFNRDFTMPINSSEEDSLNIYFYGTPLCDIFHKISESTNNSFFSRFGLKLKKCNTELSGKTYLCFMVNTGDVQPKHLTLVKKFYNLFRLTNDFIIDDKTNIEDITFYLTKENENQNCLEKANKFDSIEIEKVSIGLENGNITVKKEKLNDNNEKIAVLCGRKNPLEIKNKWEEVSDKKIPKKDIARAFKKSFNLRFLRNKNAEDILKLSAQHNEVSNKFKFGCSISDLEEFIFEEKTKKFSEDIDSINKDVDLIKIDVGEIKKDVNVIKKKISKVSSSLLKKSGNSMKKVLGKYKK